MRKVVSADNRSIFYRACAKFVTRFASKSNRHVCHQMRRVSRKYKKIATTLICYARLSQCSKPVKNSKNSFCLFIRPDHFWMELNGCRQRLLFARQLTQRKCSLCSHGTDRRVPRKQLRDKFRLQFPSRSANVANCIYSGGFSCVVSVITRSETDKRAQQTQCQREKIVGNTENECKDTPRFL